MANQKRSRAFWADRYRVSERAIGDWIGEGFPHSSVSTQVVDGWVSLNKPDYSRRAQAKAGGSAELRDLQTKYLGQKYKHEARKAKIEADQKCGALVSQSVAIKALTDVAGVIKAALDTMHLDFGADVVELKTIEDAERVMRENVAAKLRVKLQEATATALERMAPQPLGEVD